MVKASVFRDGLFDGTRALITGGGSGIGAAIAEELATLGAQVIITDIDGEKADAVSRGVNASSAGATSLGLDVTSAEDVAAAFALIADLDFVVNAAGVVIAGELADMPMESWEKSLRVNLVGPLHVARAAYPLLKTGRSSAIVNIASLAASQPYPGGTGYGVSKAALIALTKQLAVEWGGDGIRVNAISPGTIDTPMNAGNQSSAGRALRVAKTVLGRLGTAAELASTTCFLLSPAASYITGQELIVDGGLSSCVLDGPSAWTEVHRPHVLRAFQLSN